MISNSYVKLALAAALAVAGYAAGYKLSEAKWTKIALETNLATQLERDKAIAEYNNTIEALEATNSETRTKLEQVTAAAERANTSSSRLQQQLSNIASSASSCDTETTADRQRSSDSSTILVLTDLLGRADETARELAAAVDQARTRGLACEQAYSVISSTPNKE